MASRPTTSRPDVETLQRVRRIETRLTTLSIAMGVHTDTQKPIFNADARSLVVPSIHCSLKEIIDSLPQGWHEPVKVFVGASEVATIAQSVGVPTLR